MAQKLNAVTPNIKPADPENPDGSFRDKSKIYPGSPALAGFNNSTYSFFRKLMTVADLEYNGLVDTTALSQYYNALSAIIDRDIKVITDPLGSRVSVNEGAISNLENLVNSNSNAISSNSSSISTLQSRVTSNDNDISTLQSRVTSNDTDISSLSSRITSNDSDISSLSSRITSNDSDISSLSSRITSNDGELSTLNSRVNQEVKTTSTPLFDGVSFDGVAVKSVSWVVGELNTTVYYRIVDAFNLDISANLGVIGFAGTEGIYQIFRNESVITLRFSSDEKEIIALSSTDPTIDFSGKLVGVVYS